MNRTTAFCLVALGTMSASCPIAVRAADEETQFWLTGELVMPLADGVTGTLELSRRYREGDDQVQLRGAADYALSKVVSVGGGAAYVNSIDGLLETGNDRELRLQQQVTLRLGAVSLRTRVEERFIEDADRMQLRIRQRIQLATPLGEKLQGAVSGEVFYVAQSDDRDGQDQIAQWRVDARLTRRVSRRLDVIVGYLLMYTPRDSQPDKIAHVPRLTLVYRP